MLGILILGPVESVFAGLEKLRTSLKELLHGCCDYYYMKGWRGLCNGYSLFKSMHDQEVLRVEYSSSHLILIQRRLLQAKYTLVQEVGGWRGRQI